MSRTTHGTFTIEREYPFPIARVFAAWADPQAKTKWFAGPKEWKLKHRDQEFRVGGAEHLSGVGERQDHALRRPLLRHRAERADRLRLRDARRRDAHLGVALDGR